MKIKPAKLALAGAVLLMLAGCGGGGSSDSPVSGTPSTTVTLSGVAATGAAFVEAVITVLDSTGAVVGTSAPVGADGSYSVTLAEGAKAPFVLVASRTTADGEVQSLVSVLESTTVTTANVTPVTNLIASLLSASGDPMKLASELASGTTQVTADAVAATVQEVKTILAPLLEATGTIATDPLKGTFAVDGTGYDRLLDSLSINIVPASATSSNIEIAVKQALPDGEQPASISFSSTSTAVAPLPAVDAATLVESGTSVLIADFLKQLSACFALPLGDRVTAGGTAAADIQAAACRGAFVASDPTLYKSNGRLVGKGKAFNGIFVDGATGTVFNQGSYEFTRGNGDLVVGYKSKDSSGNETFDTFVLRKDTDGKLRLIGNQYQYPGGAAPYEQFRQFVTLGQSAYSYRSTGYLLSVDNQTDGSGNAIFGKVEVISPKGVTLTLKPAAGYSYLPLVKGGTTLGTNFVRLRSAFADSATTADIPTIDPGLFFSATAYSDADIAALPSQAVWTFRYFLAGNTGSTPDAIQTYKTRNRALTIAELQQQGLSQLTNTVISDIQANANPTTGVLPLPTNGPADLGDPAAGEGWTVATGALPATQVTIFGKYSGTGFNDTAKFGSTARTTKVPCNKATLADAHCSTAVAGAYASGAIANGLHLWARDSGGREYANFYAMYKLSLP